MIRFRCEHCREWLSIAETHAGETGRCPLCKQMTRVPQASETPLAGEADHPSEPHPMSRQSPEGNRALDLLREPSQPDEHESQKIAFYCETQGLVEATSRPVAHREPETVVPSRARLIDVLLYPMNLDGLARTMILALGLWIVHGLLTLIHYFPHDFRMIGAIVLWAGFFFFAVAGYMALYLSYCVFDSSKGGRRAPPISPVYTPNKGDLPAQLLLVVGGIILCFWPAALYRIFWGSRDLYFWVLASSGAFFLPMLLLASALLDGAEALSPVLIVRSIAATLAAYLGLVVRLVLLLSLAGAVHWIAWRWGLPPVLFYAAYLYVLWIGGHLLGRFYLRQKDKLLWGL